MRKQSHRTTSLGRDELQTAHLVPLGRLRKQVDALQGRRGCRPGETGQLLTGLPVHGEARPPSRAALWAVRPQRRLAGAALVAAAMLPAGAAPCGRATV